MAPADLGTVVVLPAEGAIGASIEVFDLSRCPEPAGAGDWTAIVAFGQGANSEVSFQNFTVSAAGDWGGFISVPTGLVPGAAVVTATCFDPSHTSPVTVDYTPVPFTVDASSFGSAVGTGPVGLTTTVSDLTPCPAPAGAAQWTAVVKFAQGANPQISSRNYTVSAAGHWGGPFTIPYGAVLGAAQLTATCFDPSHTSQAVVDYQASPFSVTVPTFTATPTSTAVGAQVSVSGDSPCPVPAGAGSWTAIVRFGQGANPAVSFVDLAVGATGTWSGTLKVPLAATLGTAQLTASCFDPSHQSQVVLDYAPVTFSVTADTTPPVLHLPGDRTVNATSSSGATVSYTASATDTQDPSPSVSCLPTSGSRFAIGPRTVSCTAKDLAGNTATGSFHVVVLGASSQITNLIATVRADHLRSSITTVLVGELAAARTAIAAHAKTRACRDMAAFVSTVRSRTGSGITTRQAYLLRVAAARIRTVLGC